MIRLFIGNKDKVLDQLKLALTWNRIDIAKTMNDNILEVSDYSCISILLIPINTFQVSIDIKYIGKSKLILYKINFL